MQTLFSDNFDRANVASIGPTTVNIGAPEPWSSSGVAIRSNTAVPYSVSGATTAWARYWSLNTPQNHLNLSFDLYTPARTSTADFTNLFTFNYATGDSSSPANSLRVYFDGTNYFLLVGTVNLSPTPTGPILLNPGEYDPVTKKISIQQQLYSTYSPEATTYGNQIFAYALYVNQRRVYVGYRGINQPLSRLQPEFSWSGLTANSTADTNYANNHRLDNIVVKTLHTDVRWIDFSTPNVVAGKRITNGVQDTFAWSYINGGVSYYAANGRFYAVPDGTTTAPRALMFNPSSSNYVAHFWNPPQADATFSGNLYPLWKDAQNHIRMVAALGRISAIYFVINNVATQVWAGGGNYAANAFGISGNTLYLYQFELGVALNTRLYGFDMTQAQFDAMNGNQIGYGFDGVTIGSTPLQNYNAFKRLAMFTVAATDLSVIDDFNRPNSGLLNNGWTQTPGVALYSNSVVPSVTTGSAPAIFRKFIDSSDEVNLRAKFSIPNSGNLNPRFYFQFKDNNNHAYVAFGKTATQTHIAMYTVINGTKTVVGSGVLGSNTLAFDSASVRVTPAVYPATPTTISTPPGSGLVSDARQVIVDSGTEVYFSYPSVSTGARAAIGFTDAQFAATNGGSVGYGWGSDWTGSSWRTTDSNVITTSSDVNYAAGYYIDSVEVVQSPGDVSLATNIVATRATASATILANLLPASANVALYALEYKMDALGDNWTSIGTTTLLTGGQVTFTHTASNGYHATAGLSYRLVEVHNDNTPETIAATAALSGVDIAFYSPENSSNNQIDSLVYFYDADNPASTYDTMTCRLRINYAGTTPLGETQRVVYRVTDIKTGKVLRAGNIAADGAITLSEPLYTGSQITITIPDISVKSTTSTKLGTNGVRIEFGLAVSATVPTTIAGLTLAEYGEVYVYPYAIPATPTTPELGIANGTTDTAEGSLTQPGNTTGTTKPVVNKPGPIDTGAQITIKPIVGDGVVVLVDGNGNTLATGRLPDGTPANAPITFRRDQDYIFVIYDGQVIITYKIDPIKFPDLAGVQGWIGFVDVATGARTTAPTGGTAFYPDPDATYTLRAVIQERGIGMHGLLKYVSYNQGYTVWIDENDVAYGETEPSETLLSAAKKIFWNGVPATLTIDEAGSIGASGLGSWLTTTTTQPL